MDAATFRQNFPEFADATAYPDAQVTMWLGVGAKMLPSDRWGDLLDTGLALFTAHQMVLGRQSQKATAGGGTPGASSGMLTGKTVGQVSATYDAASVAVDGGGHWNLTTYGTRFLQLARIVGAGGVQL